MCPASASRRSAVDTPWPCPYVTHSLTGERDQSADVRQDLGSVLWCLWAACSVVRGSLSQISGVGEDFLVENILR